MATTTRVSRDSLGVAVAIAVLLVYGLFRPGSLAFSTPFLIAPGLVMLWTVRRSADASERRGALTVTAAAVVGVIVVLFINTLR